MDKVIDQRDVDDFLAFSHVLATSIFPFRVSVSRGDGGAILYGGVRIESYCQWDGGSGRTDLHDLLGILWATSLRASGAASAGLWAYQVWGGAPELKSRLLFFDQPYGSALSDDDIGHAEARIKAHTAWAAHDILDAIRFFLSGRQRATRAKKRSRAGSGRIEPLVGSIDNGIWIMRRRLARGGRQALVGRKIFELIVNSAAAAARIPSLEAMMTMSVSCSRYSAPFVEEGTGRRLAVLANTMVHVVRHIVRQTVQHGVDIAIVKRGMVALKQRK